MDIGEAYLESRLGWAGPGWAGLGWAGLGWAGLGRGGLGQVMDSSAGLRKMFR